MFGIEIGELIKNVSYIGLFAIIFAETGLLIGFFLPGDTLLFTAGLLAGQGVLSLPLVILICASSAIIGDSVGYLIGVKIGPKIFNKPSSRWFKPEYVENAQKYFNKYGASTLIVARFVPIIRTFAPTMAGVAKMNYSTFLRYNIIGGLIWGVGLPILGYAAGKFIPDIDRYIIPIAIVILIISTVPVLRELGILPKKSKNKDKFEETDDQK